MTLDEFDALCEVRSALYKDIENIPTLNERDAVALTDRIVETVIAQLQRVPGMPPRSVNEWWLELAPAHARVAERITAATRNHVNIEDVLSTIDGVP